MADGQIGIQHGQYNNKTTLWRPEYRWKICTIKKKHSTEDSSWYVQGSPVDQHFATPQEWSQSIFHDYFWNIRTFPQHHNNKIWFINPVDYLVSTNKSLNSINKEDLYQSNCWRFVTLESVPVWIPSPQWERPVWFACWAPERVGCFLSPPPAYDSLLYDMKMFP